ncbi:MAG: PHP domain-containing protein [Gammaproteobacteria bacterium]|nr:PHP domain-containing protein [Gammaproteobacteria bacterium]
MILDLHAHSVKSDDGRAKVRNYCQWIRSRNIGIDGFVLTEHRQFDFESDYSGLAEQFGLVILKGSEVETEYGHVLVFGVTEPLTREFDFASVNLALETVVEACNRREAVAVPCHPGRKRVGMSAHIDSLGPPRGVRIVEVRNGGSRGEEDDIAHRMADRFDYLGIGGSDAHIVSQIGRCATRFPNPVTTETELVQALLAEEFEAISVPG